MEPLYPNSRDLRNYKEGATRDAFHRLRTASPYGLYENNNIYHASEDSWEEDPANTGVLVHDTWASSTLLRVTDTGQKFVRQTTRYHHYVPGKSHRFFFSFCCHTPTPGLVQEMCYGDDRNGIIFRLNGTTPEFLIRSDVTGTPVDGVAIPQSQWNGDRMDGTGPSKIQLDFSKVQIFTGDLQWLGVGKVRVGFELDGEMVYAHTFYHANKLSLPYMGTGTLPLRYAIYNVSAGPGQFDLRQICCAVESEGGYEQAGWEIHRGTTIVPATGVPLRAQISTTRAPVLAVRLANSFGGKPNRATLKLLNLDFAVFGGDVFFEVFHVHGVNYGASVFAPVGAEYAAEYAYLNAAHASNPTLLDAASLALSAEKHEIDSKWLSGSNQVGGSYTLDPNVISQHGKLSQNFSSTGSEALIVYATGTANNIPFHTSVKWTEFY